MSATGLQYTADRVPIPGVLRLPGCFQKTDAALASQTFFGHPVYIYTHTVSQKKQADLFLSELSQISTDFDNFWQKDGKRSKYMRVAIIFHFI